MSRLIRSYSGYLAKRLRSYREANVDLARVNAKETSVILKTLSLEDTFKRVDDMQTLFNAVLETNVSVF